MKRFSSELLTSIGKKAKKFLRVGAYGILTTMAATGVAAGAASAAAIGIVAWRKCAAVYAKSEVVEHQRARDTHIPAQRRN
jgi:hypothetical protein